MILYQKLELIVPYSTKLVTWVSVNTGSAVYIALWLLINFKASNKSLYSFHFGLVGLCNPGSREWNNLCTKICIFVVVIIWLFHCGSIVCLWRLLCSPNCNCIILLRNKRRLWFRIVSNGLTSATRKLVSMFRIKNTIMIYLNEYSALLSLICLLLDLGQVISQMACLVRFSACGHRVQCLSTIRILWIIPATSPFSYGIPLSH